MPDDRSSEDREKRGKIGEDIFILLCILALWPTILRWRSPFYEYLLYVALVGLLVVFFRRLQRFRRARKELER
jgi:hypothetical protein